MRLVWPGLAEQPLQERPSREPRHNAAAANAADQFHPQDDRHTRIRLGRDLDVGEPPRQAVGIYDDAGPGNQGQISPKPQINLNTHSVSDDQRSGEVDRHVTRGQLDLHPPRNDPLACARHIAEALIDPDQILGLPLDPARRQIGGQHSQLTAGTGRKRSLDAIIQLIRGEQAFARSSGQRLDDPIPVRMRHPQFEPRILLRRAVSWRVTVCHDLILVTAAAPRNAVSGLTGAFNAQIADGSWGDLPMPVHRAAAQWN